MKGMDSYLAPVPRGFDGVAIDQMIHRDLAGYHTTIEKLGELIDENSYQEEALWERLLALHVKNDKISNTRRNAHNNIDGKEEEEAETKNIKEPKNKSDTCSSSSSPPPPTCQHGTVFDPILKRHVSYGFLDSVDNNQRQHPRKRVWCLPGLWEGNVWLHIQTNAPPKMVASISILGPLLATISILSDKKIRRRRTSATQNNQSTKINCDETEQNTAEFDLRAPLFQEKDESTNPSLPPKKDEIAKAAADMIRKFAGCGTSEYSQKFNTAFQLWKEHVKSSWPEPYCSLDYLHHRQNHHDKCSTSTNSDNNRKDGPPTSATSELQYRVSCLRATSKSYPYSRDELLRHLFEDLTAPATSSASTTTCSWKVNLMHYHLELVVLVLTPNCVALAFTLRPYQHYCNKNLNSNQLPPDITPPYTASRLTRLRPTTAKLLWKFLEGTPTTTSQSLLQPGDVVLDPCCGIGTIPLYAPHRVVAIGGDLGLSPGTPNNGLLPIAIQYQQLFRELGGTRKNSIPNTNLTGWDASLLPIRTGSIDVVVSDLPFGKQCLSVRQLVALLPLILREMARVLRSSGRGHAVLLCGGAFQTIIQSMQEPIFSTSTNAVSATGNDTSSGIPSSSTKAAHQQHRQQLWDIQAVIPVSISGLSAWVVIARRTLLPWNSETMTIPNHRDRVKRMTAKRNLKSKRGEKGAKVGKNPQQVGQHQAKKMNNVTPKRSLSGRSTSSDKNPDYENKRSCGEHCKKLPRMSE